jgi:hypothetical protein
MKRLICLVLFMLPGVGIANQWLCVADRSTGFEYNEYSEQWKQTKFDVEQFKYIVGPKNLENQYKYHITQLGNNDALANCLEGFNAKGELYCKGAINDGSDVITVFNMSKKHGRFVMSQAFGYFADNTDSPLVTIGQCSKF